MSRSSQAFFELQQKQMDAGEFNDEPMDYEEYTLEEDDEQAE